MKKWLKILIIIIILACLSVGIYFTLNALGITSVEGLRKIISKCGVWGWIVFILLFTICSTLLCFIPGTSATFIAVSIILFGALKGFIISTISVFAASALMFLIGNTLGEKAAVKIVGKESLEKAQNLLDMKSKMLLPLMFLFPIFPDDALCMVAGMTKMRFWYFAIVVAIFRTVGIATICFLGSGFIDWAALKITDWFVLINVCVFDIVLIFKYQDKLEKFIIRKKITDKKETNNGKEEQTERKKYVIDYEWGIAYLYTNNQNWLNRFRELASDCFGIRKNIGEIKLERVEVDDIENKLTNEYERLEHSGDLIVWDKQGEKIKSEWDK